MNIVITVCIVVIKKISSVLCLCYVIYQNQLFVVPCVRAACFSSRETRICRRGTGTSAKASSSCRSSKLLFSFYIFRDSDPYFVWKCQLAARIRYSLTSFSDCWRELIFSFILLLLFLLYFFRSCLSLCFFYPYFVISFIPPSLFILIFLLLFLSSFFYSFFPSFFISSFLRTCYHSFPFWIWNLQVTGFQHTVRSISLTQNFSCTYRARNICFVSCTQLF